MDWLKLSLKNWKTTLVGVLSAVVNMVLQSDKLETGTAKEIAFLVLQSFALVIFGMVAKDSDKTGAGVKVEKPLPEIK